MTTARRRYKIPDGEIFIIDHHPDPQIRRRNRERAVRRYRNNRVDAGTFYCDILDCQFHRKPNPTWRGDALPLQVDHMHGNNRDHRIERLRLICPNCHSQQPTSGGGNVGRREMHESGGHTWRSPYPEHKEDRHLVAKFKTGKYVIK